MKKTTSKAKAGGTFNDLEWVAQNLYRHASSKIYYGVKKIGGVRRVESLKGSGQIGTTDRKIADGRLAEWLGKLATADPDAADVTMEGLFARYERLNPKNKGATPLTLFRKTFKRGMDTHVAKVKPSDIAEWFVSSLKDLEGSSYNEYRRLIARVLKLAVIDGVVPPPGIFSEDLVPKKKESDVVRNIPTPAIFADILKEMRRACEFNHPHSQAADFTEFIGVVGVGQAEAATIRLEDITPTTLKFIRMKTGKPFEIPIFSDTRALLDRLLEKRGTEPGTLFKIRDSSKAFLSAVKSLGYPPSHFTLRNLRSMKIIAWLDAGVDVKQVADWQGHSDGGKEIWERYSEVVRANKKAYLAEQIARAEGHIVRFQPANSSSHKKSPQTPQES